MAVGATAGREPSASFSVSPEDEPHTHVWVVLENEGRAEVRAEVTFTVAGEADGEVVTVPGGDEREVEGPSLLPGDAVSVTVTFPGVRASSTVPYARCPEGELYLRYVVATGSVAGPRVDCE